MNKMDLLKIFMWAIMICSAYSSEDAERNKKKHHRNNKVCISGFCLPRSYNKLEPPPDLTVIDLSLFVTDVLDVDDNHFAISLYAYVGVRWYEPRWGDVLFRIKDRFFINLFFYLGFTRKKSWDLRARCTSSQSLSGNNKCCCCCCCCCCCT